MMRLLSKLQAAMPASLTTRLALAYGLTTAAVLVGVATYLSSSLDNALRHAPAGSTVQLAVSRGQPGHTAISVVNGGPGIAPEALPHLFARFYRGDPSRRDSAKSTGLGLAIVDTIMRLHGGSVSVRSVDGQTTFELDFPDKAVSRAGA